MAGVLTARLDFSWVRWSTPKPKSCRHNSLPVSRSTQSVRRAFLPSLTWVVTKTRLPETTGELVPQPGSLTDQRIFSVLLHRVGSFLPSATPSAFGPRQRGQSMDGSWARAKVADSRGNMNKIIELRFMDASHPSKGRHSRTRTSS